MTPDLSAVRVFYGVAMTNVAGGMPLTLTELADLLELMADHVLMQDSPEGFIEYGPPDGDHECVGPCAHVMVRATFRTGTRGGAQGGVRMVRRM